MASPALGSCIITRDNFGAIHIDQADQTIAIASEVLRMMRAGDFLPQITVSDDDVVRVSASNRTVSYRVSEYIEDQDVYRGEMLP